MAIYHGSISSKTKLPWENENGHDSAKIVRMMEWMVSDNIDLYPRDYDLRPSDNKISRLTLSIMDEKNATWRVEVVRSKAGQSSATTLDIYDELAFIHGQKITLTSAAPFTPSFVLSSVAQSSDPTEVYVDRVRGRKILLENPAKVSRAQKEREKKEERRKEAKKNKNKNRLIMSRKEAKVKGVWRLEKEQARFELFVPLHHLWMGYISELMGLPQSSSVSGVPTLKDAPSAVGMHPKLVKADFHGSLLTVKQSKCPSLVGLSGIVIHETENTFRIITPENKDKRKSSTPSPTYLRERLTNCLYASIVLPKQNTIFTFSIPLFSTLPPTHTPEAPLPMPDPRSQSDSSVEATTTVTVLDMPHLEFDLYGNQFRFRSAERAGRKFKPKETIEL
ncbi:hypothetical protein K435DRAFT_835301 [Dendrothele bispora CBS 962.96]|uniref:Uncharacterized protein n=1 Tax=Dendrothele bispora (strain CBS 962.96) TaxID=1314807 RepID=A0A4V4HI10_DENBC|nr:hypothetical protein K435DRAFT_835301 [Dendrothele bispora CBS 962.96]